MVEVPRWVAVRSLATVVAFGVCLALEQMACNEGTPAGGSGGASGSGVLTGSGGGSGAGGSNSGGRGGTAGTGGAITNTGGSGTGASGGGPQTAPPPSGLSYANFPTYFMRGVSIGTFSPTVTGAPTSYSVSPAFPAGLVIDSTTGVISGTPTDVANAATYTVTATNAQGNTTTALAFAVQTGPTFQLQVTASGQAGETLSYQWAATDGAIQNTNTTTTTWIAPTGPGLHFVYVVVGNGNGGYAESRIPISTDFTRAPAFRAPAVTYPVGQPSLDIGLLGSVQFMVVDTSHPPVIVNASGWGLNVYSPLLVTTLAEDLTWTDPSVTVNAKGMAIFPDGFLAANTIQNILPGAPTSWQTTCSSPVGMGIDCGSAFSDTQTTSAYTSSSYPVILLPNNYFQTAIGHATLADGSPIGIREPFFGLNVTATGSLTGCASDPCVTAPVNAYGDFSLPVAGTTLTVSAENAVSFIYPVPTPGSPAPFNAGTITLTGTAVPSISALTATVGTQILTAFQNILPSTTGAPSDHHPEPDTFLSFKGEDSRQSACHYYRSVGAVSDCDASGTMTGAITFEDWKKAVAIDGYATGGTQTVVATYVNVVDLNLTREHHSITYGPNMVGTYVCNHAGPVDAQGKALAVDLTANPLAPDQQTAVDNAVSNAVAGKNLVACVAMDYVQDSSYASGQSPATRFLIFGPSGELLPSVNLDGRGEKFVPGACVACHGGDSYAGQAKTDTIEAYDIGAHFLPYDAGNFAFSSATGLTKPDLQGVIKQLNQNILNTNVTPATSALIAGWYAGGRATLDETYVPPDWETYASQNPGSNAVSLYQNVIARSCRTCHTALSQWNWDATPPTTAVVTPPVSPVVIGGPGGIATFAQTVICGGNPNKMLNMAMPNSLVTFDRFWKSAGTSVDQPAAFKQFAGMASCQLQ